MDGDIRTRTDVKIIIGICTGGKKTDFDQIRSHLKCNRSCLRLYIRIRFKLHPAILNCSIKDIDNKNSHIPVNFHMYQNRLVFIKC
jgi:hypothetical protein